MLKRLKRKRAYTKRESKVKEEIIRMQKDLLRVEKNYWTCFMETTDSEKERRAYIKAINLYEKRTREIRKQLIEMGWIKDGGSGNRGEKKGKY